MGIQINRDADQPTGIMNADPTPWANGGEVFRAAPGVVSFKMPDGSIILQSSEGEVRRIKFGPDGRSLEYNQSLEKADPTRKGTLFAFGPLLRGQGNTIGLILPQTTTLPTVVVTARAEPEKDEPSAWSNASPWIHGGLSVLGMIPVLSTATGAVETLIYIGEGDKTGAAMAALSMIPGERILANAAKVVRIVKGTEEAERAAAAAVKIEREAQDAERIAREADEARRAEEATKAEGGIIRSTKAIGNCGEKLAKQALEQEGYEVISTIKNASDNGVDIVARNPVTGDVLGLEVKTTMGDRAPGLSGEQRLGGDWFTTSRLARALDGKYGPEAEAAAYKAKDWLDKAKKIVYQKKEVFIEDIAKGCIERKPGKSKPWDAKLSGAE